MDITSEKITVRNLMLLKKKNMLKANPEYQRGVVWTETQQKKLIDSLFRSYPLPLIYLHHKVETVAGMSNEGLEIIDGQQRIDALYNFGEGAFKLFDPIKDEKKARFPNFIKAKPCSWANCDFHGLSDELKTKFLDTDLFVVKIKTDDEDEARDLFLRLQAGLPLNGQEKRDAWPGGFTDLVLRLAGKAGIARYPGEEFFRRTVKTKSVDRGENRQLCAQICMLVFERSASDRWADIGTQEIDDYYYRNLDFKPDDPRVVRIRKTFDLAVQLFAGQTSPKLKAHEAIHIILLLDSLTDDYTKGWQANFVRAYDSFKSKAALQKKAKAGEYWFEYGVLTQAQSAEARSIQRRHTFFSRKMHEELNPILKDTTRLYGELEREIVYYRDEKKCAVCGAIIQWPDLEIHHLEEHQMGGKTKVENGAPVHKDCHPVGQAAVEFEKTYRIRTKTPNAEDLLSELSAINVRSK